MLILDKEIKSIRKKLKSEGLDCSEVVIAIYTENVKSEIKLIGGTFVDDYGNRGYVYDRYGCDTSFVYSQSEGEEE